MERSGVTHTEIILSFNLSIVFFAFLPVFVLNIVFSVSDFFFIW